jgi:hypothetical protein
MSSNSSTASLTEDQTNQICDTLQKGCDHETAAGIAECALIDISHEIARNPRFALRVRCAEAIAEEQHMTNILKATKDGRFWRASAWWLEQRSPERFGRRAPGVITPRQLDQALIAWHELLKQRFTSPADKARVDACMAEIATSFHLLLDAQSAASRLLHSAPPKPVTLPPNVKALRTVQRDVSAEPAATQS